MPDLDSYYQLQNAYGEIIESFVPNAVARSMNFSSDWSGKGVTRQSRPPPPPGPPGPRPPPGPPSQPPPPPPPPGPGPYPDYHRHRRPLPPYYNYNYSYPYPADYSYTNNYYSYLPYFYNVYSSPYNLNYSQYIPTMNMFWDSITKSVLNFPEYPGLSDIERMKRFIIDLPTFIPCNESCKSFMKVYIQEQISNLDSICQNKKSLIEFFKDLRHQFYIKFDLDNYNIV